jgi:hypothetical protein
LGTLQGGQITVVERDSSSSFGDPSTDLSVTIQVHDPVKVSGVALLERSPKSCSPEYRDYVNRTSPFIPWPPRRAAPVVGFESERREGGHASAFVNRFSHYTCRPPIILHSSIL